ncbi:hypothetical protein [Pseudomonas sp. NA-150]|uniref:hypothetical protein n=1 Tax=Pseudomonas sp. NA-150 TaxID=3367525 RepID=UPI0037CB46AA
MRGFGIFVLVIGLIAVVGALSMDVSVSTGVGRVNNLGLMSERQNFTMVAGMAVIAGLLMVIFGGKAQSSAVDQPVRDSRPCPICAEIIKNAAIKCRHCGADVEPVVFTPATYEAIDQTLGHGWTVRVSTGVQALAEIRQQLVTLGMPIIGMEKDTVITGPFANERAAVDVSGRIRDTLGIEGDPYWMPPPAA